ncbi:MAG: right-handed parallel beta-helix repeat-containing protein [Alphaproteobacteria bacterium]|nr:right-handed parallel beta-helix repeat-containing protein [Alphaproteobacteria bacterium]
MILLSLMTGPAFAASVTLNPGDDVAALTSSMGPGDEIVFNGGTYTLESPLSWTGEGTESDPILISAAGSDEVILEGPGINDYIVRISDSSYMEVTGLTLSADPSNEDVQTGGFRVSGSNHITLQDNELGDLSRTAIYLAGDNSAITIQDNHIFDATNASGIYAGCGDASCWLQDSEIVGNWIHDLPSDRGYGVAIDNGGQNNQILDNVMYNLGYRGVLINSTEYGEPNVVEGNVMWGIASIGLQLQGSGVVRNNVVFNVEGYGIYSQDSRDSLEALVISHNTVANTDDWGIYVQHWAGRPDMVLANNAVANPTGKAFHAGEGEIDLDNYISGNVLTGFVEGLDPLEGHFTAGSGFADFMDAAGWDFYPSGASSLLGVADPAGDAWVPTLDFNGLERDGTAPDVGAYERNGSSNPGWAIQEGFKEFADDQTIDPGNQVGGCCERSKDAPSEDALFWLPLLGLGWSLRRRPRR